MRLTDEERSLLDGAAGQAAKKAMQILVALGDIYGAEDLVPVRSVQVSGVSFHNLGEAGLEWLESMAVDGRVRAVTTLNPAGMDLEEWRAQGIDPGFAERQLRLVAAYTRMGIAPTCTCTPYLVGNLPGPGEHVAWAESSAVAYANSVLGARTNREGGPSALAAALTGRTPRYGLHLDAHRVPEVEVVIEAELASTAAWGALGRVIGKRAGTRVALLRTRARPSVAELKSLGASVVTFGGSPLFFLEGLTPAPGTRPTDSIVVQATDLEGAIAELSDGKDEIDLVALGCPHASLEELAELARMLDGRTVEKETWVCTARPTKLAAEKLGIVAAIERSGARVMADTCFAVTPLESRRGATIATDSAKGAYYASGHNKLRVHLGTVQDCVNAAVTGRWR
ncbi:MAG: aconitase X catalytic domain-containing protein [Polyangiaceae bacterium]|nr:aconitase X catalytic domain-containing protein [Polyangiaceae bacterium]